MTHSYRELNTNELLTWFAKLTKGYIMKGRDDRALSNYMAVNMVTPTQVLLGMFEFRKGTETKDIPTFLRGDWPKGTDLLQDEAELVLCLTGLPTPHFYIIYVDLIDLDMQDAGFEKAFQEAKSQLQGWVDEHLSKPATTFRAGGGAARKPNLTRPTDEDAGLRRRTK